jgi:hypothetical protein
MILGLRRMVVLRLPMKGRPRLGLGCFGMGWLVIWEDAVRWI